MQHRHLNHQRYTLTAIDNVIARGQRQDWLELRDTTQNNRLLLEKVQRICLAHTHDPYAQRYHFWKHYVEKKLA